jgi:hypothetical protein
MALPTINGSSPTKIHEFYETLINNVQSLETMGKLAQIDVRREYDPTWYV